MSIIRIAKRTNPYAQIPNDTLRDQALSLAATGLLSLMLSYADGWEFNYAHLTTMKTNGRDAFRSAMKELVAAGYVTKAPKQGPDGKMVGWEWEVREAPTERLENRLTGNPSDGEPHTKNTNDKKTNEKNKPLSTSSTPSPKKTVAEEEYQTGFVESLVKVWNAHCGVLPSVKATSPKREQALLRFARVAGGIYDAVEIMERATKAVAADDFWRKNKYGLDNLLAGDKIFQKAESYEAQEAPTSAGCSLGDTVRFTSVMGRDEEGEVVEVTDKQVAIRQSRDGRVVRAPLGSIKEVL